MSFEDRCVNDFVICRIYLSVHTCESKNGSRYLPRNETSSVFSRVISQLKYVQYLNCIRTSISFVCSIHQIICLLDRDPQREQRNDYLSLSVKDSLSLLLCFSFCLVNPYFCTSAEKVCLQNKENNHQRLIVSCKLLFI